MPEEQASKPKSPRFARGVDAATPEEAVEKLERALASERSTRRRYARMLEEERTARKALEGQLERALESTAMLERQIQLTWAQLGVEEAELAKARRPLWRRLLRLPPEAS